MRPSTRPRESVYPGAVLARDGTFTCSPYLQACVDGLYDCSTKLLHAQNSLHDGVKDFPRLSAVLESERMSIMVNESTVRSFKAQIADEIEPQIVELIRRAEKGMKALERKESLLKTKVEAAQSRVSANDSRKPGKVDANRIALMTKQRSQLERELQALQSEIQDLEDEFQ